MVEQAKAGRIRALAVTSTKRSSVLPDVPTLAEAGYPGIELTPWWGVFLPAGAPQPVVDKLVASFDRILAMPETTDFLTRFANEPCRERRRHCARCWRTRSSAGVSWWRWPGSSRSSAANDD